MIEIKFYNNISESNRIDKSSYLQSMVSYSCEFKQSTNILTPSIIMKLDNASNIYPTYNYCYIVELDRYYFITNITYVSAFIWIFDLRMDVLMSYKANILALTPLVARNEFTFDNMIEDKLLFLKYNKEVSEMNITNHVENIPLNNISFSDNSKLNSGGQVVVDGTNTYTVVTFNVINMLHVNIMFIPVIDSSILSWARYDSDGNVVDKGNVSGAVYELEKTNQTYIETIKITILTTNKNRTSQTYNNIYTFNPAEEYTANTVLSVTEKVNVIPSGTFDVVPSEESENLLPTVNSCNTNGATGFVFRYLIDQSDMIKLSNYLIDNGTQTSWVISLIRYPFDLPAYNKQTVNINLGTHSVLDTSAYILKNPQSEYFLVADFTIENNNNFLDYEPYCYYEFWLPYCSWIKLSADQIIGNRIQIFYIINYDDGQTTVNVVDVTNEKLLYSTTCQLGVQVGVNSDNTQEISAKKYSNALNLGVSVLTGALGLATGGVGGVVGGAMIARGVSSFISKDNQMFEKGNGIVSSGNSGLYSPQQVRIRKTKVIKNFANDSDYAHLYGKPLNQFYALSSLIGYTEIGEVHLENFSKATTNELSEIDKELKKGVIL